MWMKTIWIILILTICIILVEPSFASNDTVAIEALWKTRSGSVIDFGYLPADNNQNTFLGGTSGEQIKNYSNVTIKLFTKTSGSFTKDNGDSTIPVDNLLYSDYGGNVPSYRALSTEYTIVIHEWPVPGQGSPDTVDVNYKLTIPYNTPPGTYSTTIYHLAEAI